MRIIKSILVTALLFLTMASEAQKKTVHVLAINDMHAYLDRAAKFGGVIDSLKALYPEMILLSAGDNRTGNPVNDQYEEPSRPMTEVMNEFGVAASAIGNHEFDANVSGFHKQIQRSKFPYLCANVSVPDSMGFKIDPYKIFDVDGIKIGVLGIIQINQRGIPDCHADRCKGLSFYEPQATIAKYVDVVRKQCDVEILLSHNGVDQDMISAQKYPQFDAILGGHTHTLVEANTKENGVLIVQSLNKMKYCTLVTFVVEDGKVIDKKSEVINILSTSQKNAKIADMVEKFGDNPYLKQVVCKFSKKVVGFNKLGSMMADGQRYATNSDIALQNGGGVRFDIQEPGNFTVKDALMLDPFGNEMVLFRLNGSEVKQIIKDCRTNDEGVEAFVSGLTYKMTCDKNNKETILDLEVFTENGKKLKDKKTYKVAVNSYVVSIIQLLKDKGGNATGRTSCECIREYLEQQGTVDYSDAVRTEIIYK